MVNQQLHIDKDAVYTRLLFEFNNERSACVSTALRLLLAHHRVPTWLGGLADRST